MALELIADVSSAQHGAVVYEVLVAPFPGPARTLPALPNIQKGDQVAFSHSKPAKQAQHHHSDMVHCLVVTPANQSTLQAVSVVYEN